MCGLVGSFHVNSGGLDDDVERLAILNNRGQEAVGIVASDGYAMMPFRRTGFVRDACTDNVNQWREYAADVVRAGCNRVIGHVRYSTVGESDIGLAQPIRMTNPQFGEFYFAHNGQDPNHKKLRDELEAHGHRFYTESDSEVLAAYLASLSVPTLSEAMVKLVQRVEGAFSVLAISNDEIVAARDRFGVRPLWFYKDGGAFFASETGALPNSAEAQEVIPGSVMVLTKSSGSIEVVCHQVETSFESAHCITEALYFSRPDQRIGSGDAASVRRMLGKELARRFPVDADIVCAVPDSGTASAVGFAEETGIRYEPCGIIRNYYSVRGRSFILPGNRSLAAKRKYSISPAVVYGRKVVVVDDTIIRTTTIPIITKMLYAAGAKEVHVRIPAAQVVNICGLGIDIKSRDELPAAYASEDEINRKIVKADSLKYLSLGDMESTCTLFHEGWCTGCFGGTYPIKCGSA